MIVGYSSRNNYSQEPVNPSLRSKVLWGRIKIWNLDHKMDFIPSEEWKYRKTIVVSNSLQLFVHYCKLLIF